MAVFFSRARKAEPIPFCQDAEGNFEFIFPITKRIAFYHNTREQVIDDHRPVRSARTVKTINSAIARFADRYVLGSSQNEIKTAKAFLDICPVPDLDRSLVLPEDIVRLFCKFGAPLILPKWKYDFEE